MCPVRGAGHGAEQKVERSGPALARGAQPEEWTAICAVRRGRAVSETASHPYAGWCTAEFRAAAIGHLADQECAPTAPNRWQGFRRVNADYAAMISSKPQIKLQERA